MKLLKVNLMHRWVVVLQVNLTAVVISSDQGGGIGKRTGSMRVKNFPSLTGFELSPCG